MWRYFKWHEKKNDGQKWYQYISMCASASVPTDGSLVSKIPACSINYLPRHRDDVYTAERSSLIWTSDRSASPLLQQQILGDMTAAEAKDRYHVKTELGDTGVTVAQPYMSMNSSYITVQAGASHRQPALHTQSVSFSCPTHTYRHPVVLCEGFVPVALDIVV